MRSCFNEGGGGREEEELGALLLRQTEGGESTKHRIVAVRPEGNDLTTAFRFTSKHEALVENGRT